MEFIDVVDAIARVGFPIVCSAAFLIIAISMMKKQQSWLEEILKDKLFSSSHPSKADSEVLDTINNKIYQEMRGVLNAINSDRAYVFLYHNGGVSSSGLYFQRMSCICEVVSPGILPVASQKQGIYRASYASLCDALKEKGEVGYPVVSDLQERDDFLYQEFIARHSYSSYFRALKDSEDHVVGFIGVDYCSNIRPNDDSVFRLLKTVANKVSSLVDIRDEVK